MSDTQRLPERGGEETPLAAAEAQLAPLAQLVEATFAELSQSVTEDLARMSSEGRQSVREMADELIEDLARLAAERLIEKPLEGALGGFAERGAEAVGERFLGALLKRGDRNG